jgi:hypothetical protein
MRRMRSRGVRPPVQGLDAHLGHQRADMLATGFEAFRLQQIAQHPRTREWVLQMQLVDAPHELQIRIAYRPRQVVHAAAADAEGLGLTGDRQRVLAVDQRFALSHPALPSARSKKSFSSVSSPIFACSVFTSTGGSARSPGVLNASVARSSSWVFHCVI